MAGLRHCFYPHTYFGIQFDDLLSAPSFGSADPVQAGKDYASHVRDLLRDGDGEGYNFNTALPSARYKVSDLVEFIRSGHRFYTFLVRDTSTTYEWLFLFGGTNNSTSGEAWFYYGSIGGTSSSDAYSQTVSLPPDNSGTSGPRTSLGWAVYVNPDWSTDTFAMEFDDATELTYTGGDYSHVPSNLPADNSTKADAFMPSTDWPRGARFGASSNEPNDLLFIFDEDEPALLLAQTAGADSDFSIVAMLGDILTTPGGSGDTRTQGTAWVEVKNTANEAGEPSHGEGYVDAFDSAGARVHDYNWQPAKTYTRKNWFVDVGGTKEAKWKAVAVGNSSDDKGWLKTSLARELGSFNDSIHHRELWNAPSSSKPMVKITNAVALMYAPDVQVFPFSFPTKE